MRILPNLLALGWAVLILVSLYLAVGSPPGADPARRALLRIGQFLLWQGIAGTFALAAAVFSLRRHDPVGSRVWWIGWTPLFGSVIIAVFVAVAVLAMRLL